MSNHEDTNDADSDDLGGKYELSDASVYIHIPDDGDNATVPHIDVCHPMVGQVVGNNNSTYVGGMPSGVFIGLKEEMIDRARRMAAYEETQRQARSLCPKAEHETQELQS